MDFFDTLRQGCAFGKAKRSKDVSFARAHQLVDTNASSKPEKRSAASVDFFGYGAQDPGAAEEDDAAEGAGEAQEVSAGQDAEGTEGGKPRRAKPAAEKGSQQHKELVASLRRKNRIHVGTGAPDPVASFDDMPALGVPEWLCTNLRGLGFAKPTAIQMQCFPAILAGGHVLASAPTGSGKTIAFLGPLLARMAKPGKEFGRTVIIDPTRELAKQTMDEFGKLAKGRKWTCRLLDKVSQDKAKNLRKLDVAIATPMRLAQLLREDLISMDATRHLVLDEADKLLDMGFAPQIDEILSYVPQERSLPMQTLMFSATMPPVVTELANSILTDPMRVAIGDVNAASSDVEQKLVFITDEDGKLFSFRQMVQEGKIKPPALIFVQSKERAKQLFGELVYDGIFADAIHADRTKGQRDNSIKAFREGRTWMLICTDVLARGVDFKGVETVINYDFPQSAATYIHRIGRTGRAGRAGKAFTLFTINDFDNLRSIVGVMRQSGCEVPDWMLRLKPANKKNKRRAEQHPPERKRISTISGWDLKRNHKRQQMVEASKSRKRKFNASAAEE